MSQASSIIGLALIIFAVFSFEKNISIQSLYTLISTIGAALIIVFATPQNLVGRLLGSTMFVFIGLISYSAYLWHQPIFVFARYISVGEPSSLLLTILIVADLVISYFSLKYVETPFRNKQNFTRKQIVMYGICFSTFFVAVGSYGNAYPNFGHRVAKEQKTISFYSKYDFTDQFRRYTCYMEPENTYLDFSNDCQKTKDTGDTLLIWGDSYAAALSKGLRSFHNNVIQYTASACPPLIDRAFSDRPNCLNINNFVKKEIDRLKPNEIFLQANWHMYNNNTFYVNLEKTISYIKSKSKNSRITIIGSSPQWEPTLPIKAMRKNISLDKEHYLFMPSYKKLENLDHELKALATRNAVEFLSILDKLCLKEECLVVVKYDKDYELTAFDNGHLTEACSMVLAKNLLRENSAKPKHQAITND